MSRSVRSVRAVAPPALLALVLLPFAAPPALASANGYRVTSGPDQNFAVTGAIDQTSSTAFSASGIMTGLQGAIGTAPFAGAAGPGVTRASMSASYSTVNNFPFSPHVSAIATTDLLVSGPAGQVQIDTSINLYVDGTITVGSCDAASGSTCDITLFLTGPGVSSAEVNAASGVRSNNFSGLVVDVIPGGRRVHGDLVVPLSVLSNTPFTVTLALQLGGRGLNSGSYQGDFFSPASPFQFSFRPAGALLNNIPTGFTVSGENVVDNRWTDPFAPTPNDVVVTDCNDPLLASLTTVTGSLIIRNLPLCTQVLLPNLISVGGDLLIAGNPALTQVAAPNLRSVGGSLVVSNNGAARHVGMGTVESVGGSLTVVDNGTASVDIAGLGSVGSALQVVDLSASATLNMATVDSVGGTLDVITNDGQVAGTTAIGATDVVVLSGAARMDVRIPAGAFASPVSFTITRLSESPAGGTAADGTPATITPISSFQFVFAVPTLNLDANLSFTIDMTALNAGEQAQVLVAIASGIASLVGRSDAPGSTYTAFPLCSGAQTPALNGCAAVLMLDAAGLPTGGSPASVRFEGVVGHFSSYGVATIVKRDVTPPAVVRETASDGCSLSGDGGWCRGTQTAGFRATDAESAIGAPCAAAAGASCSFARSTAANGAAVTIASGPVCDAAGNCNPGIAAGPFGIDSVPPALAPTIGPLPLRLGSPATASPNATDATSGVASSSCGAVDTSTAGSRTLTCTARDNAGNTSTVSVTYTVGTYALVARHWPAPGTRLRRDDELEVEVAIVDASGRRLPFDVASRLCVRFRASGPHPVDRCMSYEREDRVFEVEWRPRSTGRVDLQISVDDSRLGGPLSLTTWVEIVP